MLNWPNKDPDDVQDYGIDWSSEIDEGETVTDSAWIADESITLGVGSISGTVHIVRVSGGQTGRAYVVTNRVTTSAGRQMDRSARLFVTHR